MLRNTFGGSVAEDLDKLADVFDQMAHQIADLVDRQKDEIAGWECKLDDMEEQRDEAQYQVKGHEALKEAVWSFFDMLESPTPQIRERAVEELRDCARRLEIIG